MMEKNFCQSCGMPMQGNVEMQGTNADGSKNAEYCVYCFKGGAFTADISMEEMVRACIPHMVSAHKQMTEAQAEKMMMDFFPTLKRWQSDKVKEVFCPKAYCIALDGKGALDMGSYGESIKILYETFFALQEMCKARGQELFTSPPHTLWWLENGDDFVNTPRDKWHWRNMIEVPAYVSEFDLETAKVAVQDKLDVDSVLGIRAWEMNEGKVLQILHIGPYEKLCDSVARLYEAMEKGNYARRGYHHDIYLNDPKSTEPSQLQTLIRFPVYRKMDEPLDFPRESEAIFQTVGVSKIMTLSTTDGERVSSRNMSFIIHDGKFYFQTAREFRKSRDIEKNKHVALCVDNLQIEGVVTGSYTLYDTEAASFKKLYQEYHGKSYAAYSKLMGNRVFEITPETAQLYCYRDADVLIKNIDFTEKKAGQYCYLSNRL